VTAGPPVPIFFRCASVEQTEAVARDLAARLRPGDVLLLHGDLGAGKTTFVRGLAAGLGADPDEVSSPSFTLVQEYRGARTRLRHVDLWRLESPADIADLDLDEAAEGALVAVEWGERLGAHAPRDAWQVTLRLVDDDTREIAVRPPGAGVTPPGSSALPS